MFLGVFALVVVVVIVLLVMVLLVSGGGWFSELFLFMLEVVPGVVWARWALVMSPLCWLVVVSSLIMFLFFLFAAIIACSQPRSSGRALLERCRRRLVWYAVSDRFTLSGRYLLLFCLVLSCTRQT